jgi:glycosyltransferase involved in cell wall biosynthesis
MPVEPMHSIEGEEMTDDVRKPRLLVFVVAYNATKTITSVLQRIPVELMETYALEALVIDDSSADDTFERSEALRRREELPFPVTVLVNPRNLGYGGNQKVGYHYAIENGFDFVVLLHGDGQYAPEVMGDLMAPLANGTAEAVFGSRMLTSGGALRGGMPYYKYVGNKILTWFENRALRTRLSEFHSGYRVYSVAALAKIPFDLNTDDFHFDTEIIVQFVIAGLRIAERPIPTYYGDEICHVDGLAYAWNVVRAVLLARAQEMSLFYERKYDCAPSDLSNEHYQPKHDYASPHSLAFAEVPPRSKVLDLGCAGGAMGAWLREQKQCEVTGVDIFPLAPGIELDAFAEADLNKTPLPVDVADYDYVLMLDVIEHLNNPERFVEYLREVASRNTDTCFIVSSGNVSFAVVRMMLLFGQFNYGKRGILDLTHTRLFTFGALSRLFRQAGFDETKRVGVPAPFPMASPGAVGNLLLSLNQLAIKLSKTVFAYQSYFVFKARPTLQTLLSHAETAARERAGSMVDTYKSAAE